MNPLSVISGVSPLLGGLFKIADQLFTTDEERTVAKLKIMELQQAGALAQLEVNAEEAKHKSLFVAGWRPYIGWACGAAFTWNYILQPVFTTVILYVAGINGVDVDLSGIPQLNAGEFMPVLLGMLGLGYMRSQEKKAGVAETTLKGKNNG